MAVKSYPVLDDLLRPVLRVAVPRAIGLSAVFAILWVRGLVAPSAWAAPRGWLLDGDGRAAKVDLTRNAAVDGALVGAPIQVDDLAADSGRGCLFVPYGRGPFSVGVYDLKTLRRKAQLDFVINGAPTDDKETIRFIFPPPGAGLPSSRAS